MIQIDYLNTHCSTDNSVNALHIVEALVEDASDYNQEPQYIYITIDGVKNTITIPKWNNDGITEFKTINNKEYTDYDFDYSLGHLFDL